MCQVNNVIMEETYKAEVECLRKILAEKDKEITQLKELLNKCREKLDELDYGCEVWQGELTGFIEEIDRVIGEE